MFDTNKHIYSNEVSTHNENIFKKIDPSGKYVCVSFVGTDIYNGCGCGYDPSYKYAGKFDYFLLFNEANKPAIEFILKHWKWRGKIYNKRSNKSFVIYNHLFDGSDIMIYDKFANEGAIQYTILNNPRNFSYLGAEANKIFRKAIKSNSSRWNTPSESIALLFTESTNPSCSLCGFFFIVIQIFVKSAKISARATVLNSMKVLKLIRMRI